MRARDGRSLTEEVYSTLRSDVLYGRLEPGQRLHLRETALALGVSLGVVREAATRLASERLLVAMPHSGFRARVLTREHLDQLTWVRCHIEGLALRASIEAGGRDWEANLVAAQHLLATTPPVKDEAVNEEWMRAHRNFHTALSDGCQNQPLLEVRQQLFDEAELYRHWSARTKGATRDLTGEHQRLVDAALVRDADRAVELLEAHLRYTAATIDDPT